MGSFVAALLRMTRRRLSGVPTLSLRDKGGACAGICNWVICNLVKITPGQRRRKRDAGPGAPCESGN